MDKKQQFVYKSFVDRLNRSNWINFFAMDCNGNYLVRNPALTKVVGEVKRGDVVDEAAWQSCQKVMRTREEQMVEEFYNDRWYLSIKAPLIDEQNEVIGIMGWAVDITAQKEADELARKNEIAVHTVAIEKLKIAARSLAHEIKTPLTAVHLGLQNCKKYDEEFLAERSQLEKHPELMSYLTIQSRQIHKQIQSIGKMIKKIEEGTDLVNLQLKNMTYEHIDTTHFTTYSILSRVQEAIDSFPFKYEEERNFVHIDIINNFEFFGDKILIRHVIWNLLSNALHFIRESNKGKVIITTSQTDKFNLLHVKDTALGMPPEVAEHIFDQFYTLRRDGTGLGLSFCKMVMEVFGGDITCRTKEGEYAEFMLYFPPQT